MKSLSRAKTLVVCCGIGLVSCGANTGSPTPSVHVSPTVASAQPQAPFQFTRLPFDPENVGGISPIGDLGSASRSQGGAGHPYGNERLFIWHKQPPGRPLYNVYAPGDGTITRFKESSTQDGPQFQIYFRIDAKRIYYLAHINKLEPGLEAKISAAVGGIKETSAPIEMNNSIAVKAGDVLGQVGATPVNWDWGLTDDSYSTGITYPDHYFGSEAGHARSVWDFSTDAVRAQLIKLVGIWNASTQTFTPRVGDPPLGILGSDVKGTLSGGWFQTYDFNPLPHLVIFSPYAYDTSQLQIMLEVPDLQLFGRYQASEVQPIGSAPLNAATVTPASGITSYYLRNGVEDGVLLVRVNGDETITIEAIRGVSTAPLQFGDGALTLRR